MISRFINNLIGSRNKRFLKQLNKTITSINALEPKFKSLTDSELRAKTDEFRARLKKNETLESILPEAFATVRETSRRVLDMRHFDVQLIGGIVLHSGKIAEMRTGEGKTLVATLPAYLNALTGKGVHIVTVNDYLAKRDAAWMEPLYSFLGLTTGVIVSDETTGRRQAAYAADITYGTNNEFGFDYLRDNMVFSLADKVQRGLYFAIVDEVDSILIDEARTPLIISGQSEDGTELYSHINKIIPLLTKRQAENEAGDYYLDEKTKQAYLTEEGHQKLEELFIQEKLIEKEDSLYSPNNIRLMHHVYATLRAHALFRRNVDYIVQNDQVIIVDEHTGRLMHGRRWSEGLHQAIEAKENVPIQNENQTLASITFQNYFRLYEKLAGMTGTADTEAYEFQQIYNLEVIVIPTNQPVRRTDFPDQIYLTQQEKFLAIVNDIKDCIRRKQPVLVGTASIETSEYLSGLLQKENIDHQVLNAKFHEKEAQIIAEAGRLGKVTIATNMAGRGTDILLGGNLEAELHALGLNTIEEIEKRKKKWVNVHEQVIATGGLHIIGSERHESRRIDNQLRGRSGRQGDPGSSRFYLSLQDNLMRIFASERVATLMQKLGMKENEPIEHPWITKAIENAQQKVESHNFNIRKQLLEFDDVANEQRKVIYEQRNDLLAADVDRISKMFETLRDDVIKSITHQYVPVNSLEEQWDIPRLEEQFKQDFNLNLPIQTWLAEDQTLYAETLSKKISEEVDSIYTRKMAPFDQQTLCSIKKSIMLQTLDSLWKDHLAAMEYLRQGIHLRGYAQKNPKQEYKREAFELLSYMLDQLKYQLIGTLLSLEIKEPEELQTLARQYHQPLSQHLNYQHIDISLNQLETQPEEARKIIRIDNTPFRKASKVSRNDLCPCNSGKKYKHCHGKAT